VLTYKDGRRYEGEYKLDKMHGRGVYIWAEGARYEGEYREDKKNGRGVQTWPSGARYEGEYVDSMQTGYGLMTWADGRRYEGYWINSKCTGFGILSHKDGRRYEGEYVNDKMQGKVNSPSPSLSLRYRMCARCSAFDASVAVGRDSRVVLCLLKCCRGGCAALKLTIPIPLLRIRALSPLWKKKQPRPFGGLKCRRC
jgi:hypothetical protein